MGVPALRDDELRAELDHHDRVRAAILAMRRTTRDVIDEFAEDYAEGRRNRRPGDARPDHHHAFAMAQLRAKRLDDLADRDDLPLFFGRLWLDSGEDYHFGRRHVREPHNRSVPLVVDWRAPIAARFYRASAHQRMDVARRRRFGFRGSTLTSLEDEDLGAGQDLASSILNAEIERPRTGPMRDIVATIQPEQDELIRSDADTSLCVQGAPGTGKTAVGLHRAAWLLYSHPEKFRRRGMLVVGPSEGFLTYIGGVLPTLGETSVRQVTFDELIGALGAGGDDAPDVALIKHDARMAEVCRRAVWSHLYDITHGAVVTHRGAQWVIGPEDLADIVAHARSTTHTWSAGRKSLEGALENRVVALYRDRHARLPDSAWLKGLKKQPDFKAIVEGLWPRLTAKKVLRRLYRDTPYRSDVCADLLTVAETELLQGGPRPSAADILLLDEIESHISRPPSEKTYGHIVIDEAQDLSAMQCRAIARRSPSGSLTVLGDLAQGTTPWAALDWRTQMHHLGHTDAVFTELTVGFRVPAVVLELANRLLPHLGVSVPPARSIRSDGSVEVITGEDLRATTLDAVAKALVEEGMVGVIVADAELQTWQRALPVGDRLALVPAHLVKGLEFDHVVLVEPADLLVSDSRGEGRGARVGLRHLYVALTRAVSRLTVIHTGTLPPELGPLEVSVGTQPGTVPDHASALRGDFNPNLTSG